MNPHRISTKTWTAIAKSLTDQDPEIMAVRDVYKKLWGDVYIVSKAINDPVDDLITDVEP